MEVKKILLAALFCGTYSFAQVGVGTTTPEGALDITSNIHGFVPPRVALTALNIAAPVVNPQGGLPATGTIVWNTTNNLSSPYPLTNEVSPGMYYWDGAKWISLAGSPGGLDWSIIGNGGIDGGTVTTGGTHFLGTYDNTNIDIRTNGLHRARVSNLGEFFIGAYNTVLPGDLMNGVGNATFPWAVNGYTNFDGAGTYGLVQTGSTIFAGVQGEYQGSSNIGPGVRGLTSTTGGGTNFTNTVPSGVHGQLGNTVARAFGVKGDTGTNTTRRTGGVLGTDFYASGALGYYANNGNDYSAYGFNVNWNSGVAGGRSTSLPDTHIGLGIYGGVIGGWIKGNEYGSISTGQHFANYTLGKNITNESFIVLDKKQDGSKSPSYAATSMTIDLQNKGIGKLSNGSSYIQFNNDYSEIIDDTKPIIITITPIGESNGVHIVSVDKNGFKIKENQNGNSNISFNWIAIAEKKTEVNEISKEILNADFDKNINAVMHDENLEGGKAIWSQNGKIYFGDQAPINPIRTENIKNQINTARPKETKK